MALAHALVFLLILLCLCAALRLAVTHSNLPHKEMTMTFKTDAKSKFDELVASPRDASPKDAAVRKLGVASEFVRLGEAAKKAAKKTLTDLGVIQPGTYVPGETVTVFDSSSYTVTAKTNEPGSTLDETLLRVALAKEKLSGAAIARILAASRKEKAAATSFTVEEK